MAAKATTAASAVILNGPQDWIKWNELFQNEAVANHLWDLVNPDAPTKGKYLPAPVEPDITKYNKRLNVPVTRSATSTQTVGRSQTPAGQGGTQAGASADAQEEEDDAGNAATELIDPHAPTNTNELTTTSRQAYQIDMGRFYEARRQYDKQVDRIATLRRWVIDHVAEHYRSTDCKAVTPIHEWYDNLKKHVGSSLVYEKVQAEEAYQKAIQPLSKPPRDPIEWMRNWERAITRAQSAGVASASDSVSWWTALLKAAKKIGYGHWFDSYFAVHKSEIYSGKYDFRQLVNEFSQSSIAIAPTKQPQGVGRGAFATYHDHDYASNGSESEAEDRHRPTRRRSRSPPRNKSKRKYTGGTGSGCPACGRVGHPLPECYYIFPELAPPYFRASPRTQDGVKTLLEKSEELRKEVEHLKKKKKRPDSRERYRKKSRERKEKDNDGQKEVRFEETS